MRLCSVPKDVLENTLESRYELLGIQKLLKPETTFEIYSTSCRGTDMALKKIYGFMEEHQNEPEAALRARALELARKLFLEVPTWINPPPDTQTQNESRTQHHQDSRPQSPGNSAAPAPDDPDDPDDCDEWQSPLNSTGMTENHSSSQ